MAPIVFFDPYPISQLGLKQILKNAKSEIGSYMVSSVRELAALADKESLNLLILTVNTPKNRNPLPVLEECREICPDAEVILYDEEYYVEEPDKWLKAGVSGYVLKSESATVLLQCIETVLDGGKFLSPAGLAKYLSNPNPKRAERTQKLGVKEYEVARYLSVGQSTTWIANRLGRKPSTISTVKRRIFVKLNVHNVVELCSIFHTVRPGGRNAIVRKLVLSTSDAGQSQLQL